MFNVSWSSWSNFSKTLCCLVGNESNESSSAFNLETFSNTWSAVSECDSTIAWYRYSSIKLWTAWQKRISKNHQNASDSVWTSTIRLQQHLRERFSACMPSTNFWFSCSSRSSSSTFRNSCACCVCTILRHSFYNGRKKWNWRFIRPNRFQFCANLWKLHFQFRIKL